MGTANETQESDPRAGDMTPRHSGCPTASRDHEARGCLAVWLLRCAAISFVGHSLAAGEIKQPPAGLVSFGFPPKAWDPIFNCMVYKCRWQDLEHSPGRYDPGFQTIDEMLERAGERGLSVHLMILCGADSPDWLKAEVGTVTVFDPGGLAYNPEAKGGRICARWWDPRFGEAYLRMQRALADRYDAHPGVAAVGMNRCMSFWPEPFMRKLKDPKTRANLREAGYSTELDNAAHRETLRAHGQCWRRTCSSIALNPYEELSGPDSWRQDVEFTAAFIREAARILGSRLILQNDSFVHERAQLGEDYWKMYDVMRASGAVFGLQPRGTTRETIGDVRKLIEAAIRLGAGYLELVNIYEDAGLPREELVALDKALEANAAIQVRNE